MRERSNVAGSRLSQQNWARRSQCRRALLLAELASAALGCARVVGVSSDEYYLGNAAPDPSGATADVAGAAYATREGSVLVGGMQRSFLVARPSSVSDAEELPLVFSFHGHSDTAQDTAERIRAALRLEDAAAGAATFVYPRAPGVAWPFTEDEQRATEAAVVIATIDQLSALFGVDRRRVFLVGWDGGAFLVNSVACRLPAGVLRGVAIHSGSLYAVRTATGRDFDETPSGRTTCSLPSALLIWGTSDLEVNYGMQGTLTRSYYAGTLGCAPSTSPWLPAAPCVSYDACSANLIWCAIPELGHALWSDAAASIWSFVDSQR